MKATTTTKPATEVHLYTKAEREAAEAAWRAEERNRRYSHEAGKLAAADMRSLPTRKARVGAFLRTGKVPGGWMTPDTVKFGGIMTDKEAARVVLPIGLRPATTFAPSLRDEVTERVVRRYLTATGARLKTTTRSKPWPAYEREVEVWSCGCEVEGTGKVTVKRHGNGPDEESYHREVVKPCERHKAAFEGREEE